MMNNIALMKVRAKTPTYVEDKGEWIKKQFINPNDRSSFTEGTVWLDKKYVREDSVCRFTGLKDFGKAIRKLGVRS